MEREAPKLDARGGELWVQQELGWLETSEPMSTSIGAAAPADCVDNENSEDND